MVEGSEEREARLAERAEREALLIELRRLLVGTPVWLIGTYLAERMGCAKTGHFTIRLQIDDGHVRRGWLERGPMGHEELEELDLT